MRRIRDFSLLPFITVIIARLKSRAEALVDSRIPVPGEVMVVSENEKKARKVWLGEISCAFCGKRNSIKVEKQTIEPAVPAETEIRVTVEKSLQTVLA
jgi:hypothetical protein